MQLGQFDLVRYLRVLPLFSDLSASDLDQVAGSCQLVRLSRQQLLFRAGEACEQFFVVVTGQVKLFAISPDGHEKVVELLGPGNSFAEAVMFLGKPYALNAQALADTLLISIAKQAVLDEIENSPRFSLRMLSGLSRRLHGMVQDVQAYALHSGMQRVIGYLLRDQRSNGNGNGNGNGADNDNRFTVTLPVNKATLASRLSITPEYFSRVLHELEAQGLIQIDKRDIHVVDANRLSGHGLH